MAKKILIRRSVSNSTVTGLSGGEFAYTEASNTLWIGLPSNGKSIAIGGARYPGILTANQAMIANSTSGIDRIIVANLVPTRIFANGSTGNSGQILASNGTSIYWSNTSISVSPTYIQNTDSRVLSGNLTFSGSNVVFTSGIKVGNATVGIDANSSGIHTTGIVNSSSLSISNSLLANSTRIVIGSGIGLQTNGSVGSSGQVLTSNGTSSYWANSTVTAGDGLISNSSGIHVGQGNGISVSADSIAVVGSPTVTVNTSGVHVNNTLTIQDLTVSGNLSVLGDLVSMNVSTLSIEDSLVTLAKNQGATGTYIDALDIGFVGTYGNTSNLFYSGLFRDQSDSGLWKLFTSNGSVTNSSVDTSNTSLFKLSTLQTYISSGGLSTNSSSVNISANATTTVTLTTNSVTITSPLVATSGGSGWNIFSAGDVLVASNSTFLSKLQLGASGYVLQSNGTTLVYDVLDGGIF